MKGKIQVEKVAEGMETDDGQPPVSKTYDIITKAEMTETDDSCLITIINFECPQQHNVTWSVPHPSTLIFEVSDFKGNVTLEAKKLFERMETDDYPSSTVNKVKVIMMADIIEEHDSCTVNNVNLKKV